MKATVGGQPYTVGGDIILKIADITISAAVDLVKMREKLGSLPSGSQYGISVMRGGKVLDLTGCVP